MRVDGYGAGLELDDDIVTIHHGRLMARASGTQTIRVPVGDVERLEHRSATRLVNGRLRVVVRDESPERLQLLGEGPAPSSDEPPARLTDVLHGVVTPASLVVHWRYRDRRLFEKLAHAISQSVAWRPGP